MYSFNNILLPVINDDTKKLQISMATHCVAAYSGNEFEEFVLEWLKYCKNKINADTVIGQVGGCGDQGVDIYLSEKGETTYYQCKRYNKAINENEVCEIVTKVLYYSYIKSSLMPNNLVVIAFSSFKAQALLLFDDKNKMRDSIIKKCDTSLSKMGKKTPTGFCDFLKEIDYAFVSKIDVDEIIMDYYNSKYGHIRFLKSDFPDLRIELEDKEYKEEEFVKQIEKFNPPASKKIIELTKEEFYSALSLKETARYLFGNSVEFENAKEEVYQHVKYKAMDNYVDQIKRMTDILAAATDANTSFSYLDKGLNMIRNKDRQGMCHFLVNEKKFSWEKVDD